MCRNLYRGPLPSEYDQSNPEFFPPLALPRSGTKGILSACLAPLDSFLVLYKYNYSNPGKFVNKDIDSKQIFL